MADVLLTKAAMKIRPHLRVLSLAAFVVSSPSASALGAADAAARIGADPTQYRQVVGRAIEYLEQAQAGDGSYSSQAGGGVTAIAATALMRHGRAANDPVVAKALRFLEGQVQSDGGIYETGSQHRNYDTCLAIQCFREANDDGRFNELLNNAERYVKQWQWDAGEDIDESHPSYGGAGYGGKNNRPDLSNTSFLVDALHSLGRDENDPALQKALVFVSRCQNLESQYNQSEFSAKVNDGGFYYTVAAGGSSFAGITDEGGLRSYGSMTYAGLKSMIFAGVGPNDERVKAAREWISKHYTLAENPGMDQSGLFYYYHTFAKALDAVGNDTIVDSNAVEHDWRRELVEQLGNKQKSDGSWINSATRWMEGDPNLVTSYSLLALSYCKPKVAAQP